MSTISSPVPGIFTHFSYSSAAALFAHFAACNQSKDLLESERVVKPLHIYLHLGDRSKLEIIDPLKGEELQRNISKAIKSPLGFLNDLNGKCVVSSNLKPSLISTIHLSKKIVDDRDRGLNDLTFRIFDRIFTDPIFASFLRYVEKGEVSMDDYAETMSKKMILQERAAYQLIKTCANSWNARDVLPDFQKRDWDAKTDLELALFAKDLNCQMNDLRSAWIDRHQEGYCAKRPNSDPSCSVKTNDLCNLGEVHKKYKSERDAFMKRRFCQLFPKAHQKVQDYPPYRGGYEDQCKPSGPNTFQAILISIGAGLAAGYLGFKWYPR